MEEQSTPVVFSEWLKRRRKALDMTQDELAIRAGCSLGALRKIESGERRPSKQLAGLLAKALEISSVEDQQTFIRVARGELSLERLLRPSLESQTPPPAVLPSLQPQLSPQPAALPSPMPPANRLPIQSMPLIGRETELAALERLFDDPHCRLLTLTGIGGIGKTRLALEFAAQSVTAFPGGTFYIPLTAVNSPNEIVPAIADVLDFGFSGPTDPKEQLFNFLAGSIRQEALFVLDNLEHLLVKVDPQEGRYDLVDLVSEILHRLPNTKILGTSRERLNLHGEWTYELHGLSVPPAEISERLEAYDSVELFVKSAQRASPDFQGLCGEPSALVQICRLVEGVPLALELAAAWVGMLACQEIAQEIEVNMDFLMTSMRDIPARHRSIRATFDHSWKLLSEEERRVLCRLSVFHGGFDRKAASQIAGATLPLLASLSAKSLVRRTESGRYDLHEVIRQYALSYLVGQMGWDETHERHCEYYLTFVLDRENALKSAAQQEAIRQLTGEIDNIRAAWAWGIDHEKYARLGAAGRAFGWYFEVTGLYHEGIELLELLVQALKSRPQAEHLDQVLGLALLHQALLYFRTGDFDQALYLYSESILLIRPTGDPDLLADALIFHGVILHLNGEYEQAKSDLEEGLLLARAANKRWFEAFGIFNLGFIAALFGDLEHGYAQMRDGISIWRELGDPHAISLGLNFMVPTLNKLGHYQEARANMQESIALCEQSKNRWGMGTAYRYLGLADIGAGEYAEAKKNLLKSLEIFGQYFTGWDIARSLCYLGDAARLSGDLSEARKNYLDALRLSIHAKATPIALDALAGLGCLQAQTGEVETALILCYYIQDHPASEEQTKKRTRELRSALELELNAGQVQAAHDAALCYDPAQPESLAWIVNATLGPA